MSEPFDLWPPDLPFKTDRIKEWSDGEVRHAYRALAECGEFRAFPETYRKRRRAVLDAIEAEAKNRKVELT